MHILGAVLIQEIHRLPQLGAPDDGVVHKQQLLVPDQLVHRDLLHLGNHVPLLLGGGHKASRPGRSIFDKRSCKRHTAFVGVADSVGSAGIRDAAHIVNVLSNAVFLIGFRHDPAVAVAHILHALALVAGGRVAVIGPEKGADFLFFPGRRKNLNPIGRNFHDLTGAQLPNYLIAQLFSGVVFKGGAVGVLFLFNHNGKPPHFVSGGDDMTALPEN